MWGGRAGSPCDRERGAIEQWRSSTRGGGSDRSRDWRRSCSMRQQSRLRSLTASQPSSAHTTHYVSRQWIGSGTAISAPIAPLAALAVFAVLTAAMATPGDLARGCRRRARRRRGSPAGGSRPRRRRRGRPLPPGSDRRRLARPSRPRSRCPARSHHSPPARRRAPPRDVIADVRARVADHDDDALHA